MTNDPLWNELYEGDLTPRFDAVTFGVCPVCRRGPTRLQPCAVVNAVCEPCDTFWELMPLVVLADAPPVDEDGRSPHSAVEHGVEHPRVIEYLEERAYEDLQTLAERHHASEFAAARNDQDSPSGASMRTNEDPKPPLCLDPRVFYQLLNPRPDGLQGLGPHGPLSNLNEQERSFIGGRVFATMSPGPIEPRAKAAEMQRVWHAVRSDVIPGGLPLPGRKHLTVEEALLKAGHHDGMSQIAHVIRTFAAAGDLRSALVRQRQTIDAMLEQLDHFALLAR